MTKRTARLSTTAAGSLADGTLIWAYSGSSDDSGPDDGNAGGGSGDGDDGGGDSTPDGDDESDGDESLTKALESERKTAERNRKYAAPWRAIQREFGVKPDDIRAILAGRNGDGDAKSDAGGDEQVDVEKMRRQITAEVTQQTNARLVRAQVTVEATALLQDPNDAARFLDISDYDVDDEGNVDAEAIKNDLKALIRDKPYLGKARRGDGRNGSNPDQDGGSRSGGTGFSMDSLIRNAANRHR